MDIYIIIRNTILMLPVVLSVYATSLDFAYAADLKIANKTRDDSSVVRYGKAILIRNGNECIDSLILNEDGQGIFYNLITGITEGEKTLKSFHVYQNYPNPFNPSTRITVDVAEQTSLTVGVYSILGQLVRSFSIDAEPGCYMIEWGGRNNNDEELSSGIYIARLYTQEESKAIKMIMLDGGGGKSNVYKEGVTNLPLASKITFSQLFMYKIHFTNTDSTIPKIVEWTTEPFGISGDTSITFYSVRLSLHYTVYDDSGIPEDGDVWTWSGATWGGPPAVFDGEFSGESPPEGNKCFKTTSGSNWEANRNYAGWGMFLDKPSDHTTNLTSYTHLKFWVKTLFNLKVEIQQGNRSGGKYRTYINNHGWNGTNNWQEISIPVGAFPGADLGKVFCPFMITVEEGDKTFFIDNVRWMN